MEGQGNLAFRWRWWRVNLDCIFRLVNGRRTLLDKLCSDFCKSKKCTIRIIMLLPDQTSTSLLQYVQRDSVLKSVTFRAVSQTQHSRLHNPQRGKVTHVLFLPSDIIITTDSLLMRQILGLHKITVGYSQLICGSRIQYPGRYKLSRRSSKNRT